jgi:hypothetical protein
LREDIGFMRRHIDHPLNWCRIETYSGTPLERRMMREGRARGDYLARTYAMRDERVQAASDAGRRIFHARCWSPDSLMEFAVGQEHVSAVLGHFYKGEDVETLRRDLASWLHDVNVSTVDLLERLVEGDDPDRIATDENRSRHELLEQGRALRAVLDALVYERLGVERREDRFRVKATSRARAAHRAAVVLAMSLASATTLTGCELKDKVCEHVDILPEPVESYVWDKLECYWFVGVCEYAAPPLDDSDGDGLPDECEITIFNTDPAGPDTDGDTTPDPDEDHDGDGLTNLEEQNDVGDYHCRDVVVEDAATDAEGDPTD